MAASKTRLIVDGGGANHTDATATSEPAVPGATGENPAPKVEPIIFAAIFIFQLSYKGKDRRIVNPEYKLFL